MPSLVWWVDSMKLRNLHKGNGNWGVKCNKLKTKLKWKIEERTLMHSMLLTPREETFLGARKGSDPTLPSQQEEGKIPPYPVTAPPMGDCYNSANEKSLYFQLSTSSNGLFIYNPLPSP